LSDAATENAARHKTATSLRMPHYPLAEALHQEALHQAEPGIRNTRGVPASFITASAARYPLRTAPSIVAGQPERVQSPARKRFRTEVRFTGRCASRPGLAENVARISLTTCDFSRRACWTAGKNSANSRTASAITSSRLASTKLREALTTSS